MVTKISRSESANDKIYYKEHELLPYCPEDHYYDETKEGCSLDSFEEDDDTTDVIAKRYEPFTAETEYRLRCCELCTVCDLANGEKKDTQNYKYCDGTGIKDTQAHCVLKCPFGHYESEDKNCKKCKTCSCGESPESFINQKC